MQMQNWAVALIVAAALVILVTTKNFAFPKWLLRNIEIHWRAVLIAGLTLLAGLACVTERIRLGLDLKGGTELLYRIAIETVPDQQRVGITGTTISVLEKRLSNRLSQLRGTSEMRMQEQGAYRILIQVPGADAAEVANIKSTIQNSGRLEFHLVNDDADDRREAAEGHSVHNCTPYVKRYPKGAEEEPKETREGWYEPTTSAALKNFPGDWLLVYNTVDLTGQSLAGAHVTVDQNMMPAVGFDFDTEGRKKFALLTDRNVGKQLAIVLDNKIYSAPVIKTRISGAGIIEGTFTQAQVQDLVTVLRSGALPAQLSLELENTVGPTLGWDSIKKGITSALAGAALVAVFMIVYYHGTGAVAVLAVVSNILLMLGIMAVTKQTLTLPGIAGLVLTMAMAVDANVLINERIREEKERGKMPKLAVKAGYERVFSVIFDSHVTGIITSVILYMVGTGPVQGFAVTLGLGLVVSLFTALFVTRTIIEYFLDKGWMTELSMLQLFKRPNFQFMRVRYLCYALSLVVTVGGMSVFALRWNKIFDIDFTGGTLLDLELKNPLPTQEVRKRIADAGYRDAEVQSLWAAAPTGIGGQAKDFGIRIPAGAITRDRMAAKVQRDIEGVLNARGVLKTIHVTVPPEEKEPLPAEILLKKGIDEATLRDALRDAGYQPADIESIQKPSVKASRFRVMLRRAETDHARRTAVRGVVNGIKDLIATTEVSYNFGKAVEEAAKAEAEAAKSNELAMSLSRTVDPLLLETELDRLDPAYSDLTVVASTRSGAQPSDRIVQGSKELLEKLRSRRSGSFALPPVKYEEPDRIEVELKQPVNEEDFRAMLAKQPGMEDLLGVVVPLGTTVDKFTVKFNPLNQTKIQEEVRDDIARAFKEDIAAESLPVKLEPTSAPATGTPDEASLQKMTYFNLQLPKPVAVELIRNKLIKAGYEWTLSSPAPEDPSKTVNRATLQAPKPELEQVKSKVEAAFKEEAIPAKIEPLNAPILGPGEAAPPATAPMAYASLVFEKATSLDAIQKTLAKAALEPVLFKPYYTQVTLRVPKPDVDRMIPSVTSAFESADPFRRVSSIGSSVAAEMKQKAFVALALSWVAIILYLWFRFGEAKFGVAAVIALIHDVFVAMGFVAIGDAIGNTILGQMFMIGDIKINLTMVAAFLTIIGYSVSDTIVVYDRIRENRGAGSRFLDAALVDASVNQTLSRTVLTSVTVWMVLLALYFLGGPVIHGFAYCMFIGVLTGTYSSVFIASPIIVDWIAWSQRKRTGEAAPQKVESRRNDDRGAGKRR